MVKLTASAIDQLNILAKSSIWDTRRKIKELEINEFRKNIQKNKFYIFPFLKNRYIYFVLRIFLKHTPLDMRENR